MIEDSKTMLHWMGVPIIEAPGEAEAQCAEFVKSGRASAVASEDMDSLTFGAKFLLRGFNSKKEPITEICLDEVLTAMDLTYAEFVDLCILLGCDYTEHVEGIGPATAYKFIKQWGCIEECCRQIAGSEKRKYRIPVEFDYEGAREIFLRPDVIPAHVVDLVWNKPDEDKLANFLVSRKGFNPQRVESGLKRIKSSSGRPVQTRLDSFFGKPLKRSTTGPDEPRKKKVSKISKK